MVAIRSIYNENIIYTQSKSARKTLSEHGGSRGHLFRQKGHML